MPQPNYLSKKPLLRRSGLGDALMDELTTALLSDQGFLSEIVEKAARITDSEKPQPHHECGKSAHTTVPLDAQIVSILVGLATDDWVPLTFLRGFGSEPTLRRIARGIETRIIDKKRCVRIREFLATRRRLAEGDANALSY